MFLITHEFHPRHGGIATFAEEMARAVAGLGHDTEVWAQAAPPGTIEKPWPFRLRRLPLKGTHDLACMIRLAREFIAHRRQLRHATVYLPEPGPIQAMLLLQLIPGFRPPQLFLTFHGSEILKFHRHPLKRCLARRLIRHADCISVLTGYTHRLLCQHFPEAAVKTLLTPGALRTDLAFPSAAGKKDPRDRMVILTVGRLHPRKGQLCIIEALQTLPAAQRTHLEYWLAGDTSKKSYERRLRDAAERSGLVVRFLGSVPDAELGHLYAQADIFAMTSTEYRHSVEGFGLVYLEAAAHGLPVVAHAVGGVPEAVADGMTGLLVPPSDRAGLAAAFSRLIENPELRHKMGAAGREWARRNNWTRSAALLFSDQAGAGADRSTLVPSDH
ncbi:MAG: glycosyltransferase family 4 protein [Opitutaceae bacterium]|nr:glycosyltransferase family 4 protein [Opitutaceae bacterium]